MSMSQEPNTDPLQDYLGNLATLAHKMRAVRAEQQAALQELIALREKCRALRRNWESPCGFAGSPGFPEKAPA
jgi:hypothetical protein